MTDPLDTFPRVPLAHLPTPLDEPAWLRALFTPDAPRLFIKRDDCTGLAFGGNKTRKLEYLVGEAQAAGADTLVTTGALQSNHARQTAAAAAAAGMACTLVLFDIVPGRGEAYRASGNLLLDQVLGADIRIAPADAPRRETLESVVAELEAEGRQPFFIPTGGSTAIGALGYARAYRELVGQLDALGIQATRLVHASSSGGTQAGLIAGHALLGAGPRVEGVNVYRRDHESMAAEIGALAAETASLIGAGETAPVVLHRAVGPGYGEPMESMVAALTLAARRGGLLLDPVYSGKAFAGLLAMIQAGEIGTDETIVFLHTGGAPGLFAYPDLFAAL